MHVIIMILSLLCIIHQSFALWCYQCSPSTPGCSTPFNWRGLGWLGNPCPDHDDICIKLIERKGAQEVITRDCLSNLRPVRKDIPADTYEGCRPAVRDEQLAHYVNNSIKEYDIKRDYYDETTWCFCFLDHRCNKSSYVTASMYVLLLAIMLNVISLGQ